MCPSTGAEARGAAGTEGGSVRPVEVIVEPNAVKKPVLKHLRSKAGGKIEGFEGVEPTAHKPYAIKDVDETTASRGPIFNLSRIVTTYNQRVNSRCRLGSSFEGGGNPKCAGNDGL